MLSEDDIKHRFLPFLKEFYKYRYEYRPDTVSAELDNVSGSGLMADGMVSFRQNDGTPFVCTYEATSVDKAEEVKFSLNTVYFIWDCLAFASVVMAAVYVAMYYTRFPWLVGLKWAGNIGFMLGIGLIGFFAWYFTMQQWRKYRYIYAVEQFKQYFADEQWIALGDDVFPSPTDPYLLELRNQCVYNGFGLALVPERGEVRVLLTPSRLGIFGKDRRMVHWVTRLQWYQTMSHNASMLARYKPTMPKEIKLFWNRLWRPIQYLALDPARRLLPAAFQKDGGQTDFHRFMQAHGIQKWVLAMAFAVIGLLAYRVLTVREDDVRELVERPELNPEDQYGYLYEGEPAYRDPRAIPKQYPEPAAAPAEDTVQTINLSGEPDETPTINLSGDADSAEASAQTKPKAKNASADTPCDRYNYLKGWIVQDNAFSSKVFADERVTALRRMGLQASVIPKRCMGDGGSGFIVQIGVSKLTEAAANSQAEQLSKSLQRYGLWQGKLLVRRF